MCGNSLGMIPYWGMKAESLGLCVSKVQAFAKFIGMGDKMNLVLLTKCLTQLEYGAIVVAKPDNQTLVDCTRRMKCYG